MALGTVGGDIMSLAVENNGAIRAVDELGRSLQNLGNSAGMIAKGARTQFLFMSFGLMTVQGMVNKVNQVLEQTISTSINNFMQLEYSVRSISVMMSGTEDRFQDVYNTVINLSQATTYSIDEVTDGMRRMVMAGMSAEVVLGGMVAVLNLAKVGFMSVSEAAETTATIYKSFGFQAKNASESFSTLNFIINELNYVAKVSQASIQDVAESLKYTSAIAEELGYSLTDVLVSLQVMTDAGIKGSMAGRALRTMMINLARIGDTSNDTFMEVTNTLKEQGFTLDDGTGKLKSWLDTLEDVREIYSQLNAFQKTAFAKGLFGTTGAAAGMELLSMTNEELQLYARNLSVVGFMGAFEKNQWTDARKTLVALYSEIHTLNLTEKERIQLATDISEKYNIEEQLATDLVETLQDQTLTIDNLNDAIWNTKTAAEMADERLNTLRGTLDMLNSTVFIMWSAFGEALAPLFTALGVIAKEVVKAFEVIPKWGRAPIAIFVFLAYIFGVVLYQVIALMAQINMLAAATSFLNTQMGISSSTAYLMGGAMKSLGFNVGKASGAFELGKQAMVAFTGSMIVMMAEAYLMLKVFLWLNDIFKDAPWPLRYLAYILGFVATMFAFMAINSGLAAVKQAWFGLVLGKNTFAIAANSAAQKENAAVSYIKVCAINNEVAAYEADNLALAARGSAQDIDNLFTWESIAAVDEHSYCLGIDAGAQIAGTSALEADTYSKAVNSAFNWENTASVDANAYSLGAECGAMWSNTAATSANIPITNADTASKVASGNASMWATIKMHALSVATAVWNVLAAIGTTIGHAFGVMFIFLTTTALGFLIVITAIVGMVMLFAWLAVKLFAHSPVPDAFEKGFGEMHQSITPVMGDLDEIQVSSKIKPNARTNMIQSRAPKVNNVSVGIRDINVGAGISASETRSLITKTVEMVVNDSLDKVALQMAV